MGYVGEELTPEFAIANAPNDRVRAHWQKVMGDSNRPAGLTPAEKVELQKFEVSLANQNVTERHNQAHGGQRAMEQKAAVTESLLSNNIHQGK